MQFAILKGGIVKSKNYCPNPVVKHGIPAYADSVTNPKCKGTAAHNEWWEEQIDRILNGYETGGIWIPGRYYKFVNFDTIRGVAGDSMRAELHDFQLDYAYLIEEAKKEHFNILVPKARRKTVTTMNVCMNIDYGYRFEPGYKAGIIAGQQKFANVFYEEWQYTDSKQYPELRIKQAQRGEDTIAGYKIDTPEGDKIDGGTRNSIYLRTVFHDPNVMKGKYLNDAVLEESGENEKLVECVNATMDCLMRGDIQYGTLHIYGCVCAGTKVYTNDRKEVNIEDLKQEQGILGFSGTGVSEEPIIWMKPPAKKPCYRITTHEGSTLECSGDHPLMWSNYTWKQDGVQRTTFIRAMQVRCGDHLMMIDEGNTEKYSFQLNPENNKGECYESLEYVTGICYQTVQSVEYIGMKDVYNLTAGKTHTYIANNFVTGNTGGNMNKGSKGFKKMYYDAITKNKFNCRTLFVPATVFYFPYYAGATNPDGTLIEDIPNLQHMQPHERRGWSDEERALERIEQRKKELLSGGDLNEYFDYCQNNPTNVKEVFRKSSGNNFPVVELNDQGHLIESETKRYGKYKLKYKTDPNGKILIPYEVDAIPATDFDPENECVMILHEGHPVEGFRWLDGAGIDSYDIDRSQTSNSLGAMVVFRGKHNIPNLPDWCPVALIRTRPPRKEQFYEMCMMLSIYYKLIGAVLIDVRNFAIGNHFKEMGCERYLAKRPRKYESPESQQTTDYGFSLNNFSKPRMISALQSFFYTAVKKVWFGDIIDEALNYDEVEIDSDNDTVDALGIALIRALDQDQVAENEGELMKRDPFAYPEWGQNMNGDIIDLAYMKKLDKDEPLGEKEDYFSRYSRIVLNQEADETPSKDDFYDF